MSHLMPAALYNYCRPPGGHHITVTNDLMIETDRHLQGYLLCGDCENDLNRGGETWLMPLLVSYEGSFPFHALLEKVAGWLTLFSRALQCRN